MSATPVPAVSLRRLGALTLTLGLHLALWWGWRLTSPADMAPDTSRIAIDWVDVKLAPAPVSKPLSRRQRQRSVAPALASEPARAAPATVAPALPADWLAEATPAEVGVTPSTADMLERAKRDIGKFDKELRKEFAPKGIRRRPDSPQIRLARGMQEAYEAVPPKWYESAKITEVIEPGQYGRRRYRVRTAFGTYCATVESPNSPIAQLDVGKRVEPKLTNCPPGEQPATPQDW